MGLCLSLPRDTKEMGPRELRYPDLMVQPWDAPTLCAPVLQDLTGTLVCAWILDMDHSSKRSGRGARHWLAQLDN